VIATGETHSVREFAEKVFARLGMDYRDHVQMDKRYFRPTAVNALLGDASKAQKKLGWKPKVTFEKLIDMMIAADMDLAKKEKTLLDAGLNTGKRNSEKRNSLIAKRKSKIGKLIPA
jgi:GDPmannose 4,6-dehydratase